MSVIALYEVLKFAFFGHLASTVVLRAFGAILRPKSRLYAYWGDVCGPPCFRTYSVFRWRGGGAKTIILVAKTSVLPGSGQNATLSENN